MATRAGIPQQQQQQAGGEAAVGGVKQSKNVGGAQPRNRRALGDIGNLVTVREVEAKANRPITRSFRAQLLAKAQVAPVVDKNKKQLCPDLNVTTALGALAPVNRISKEEVAPKVIQKKPTVKPKPVKVNEIIPDTLKKKKEMSVKKKNEKDSRTLTSVLTARSKAACGLTTKPKEKFVDIDAADAGNELAAVEYVEDLYKFYKLAENENRPRDYMDSQPEVNCKMRAILVDWLIDVHSKFELSNETLYLTINIVDRFLGLKTVPRKEVQLVGIGAMLIASKYEEIWPPEVNDFVCLSDRAYSHEQILRMEKVILGTVEWTLTVPTPYVFLVRFIKASNPDKLLENMVHFLSELGMMQYATTMHCPSLVAASAVFAARCTLNQSHAWNETLKLHTGYSEEQLMDCARLLVSFHSVAAGSKLQVVYKKYSDIERGAVAQLPPAKNLLPGSSS